MDYFKFISIFISKHSAFNDINEELLIIVSSIYLSVKIRIKNLINNFIVQLQQEFMLTRQVQVDEIIGKANFDKSKIYLIKWKNKSINQSSWKHQRLLSNVKQKLTAFNKQFKDIELPIISPKYQQILEHKLHQLNQQQYAEVKQLNKQNASKKVEDIIGKAKVGRNILYLIKWENQPVSASTWQAFFKLQILTKKISKFNKENQHQNLPFIDNLALTYYDQVHNVQNNQKKLKKQQLSDKKLRKVNENKLNLLIDQLMKKLKRLQKNYQKQRQIKTKTQNRQKKTTKIKTISEKKEQQLCLKQSQSSNQNDEEQKQVPQQSKIIKQELQQKEQKVIFEQENEDLSVDFLKELESGQMIDQIAKRIKRIQSESQKNRKQQLIQVNKKQNIYGPKIEQPFQEDNSQSIYQSKQQPLNDHSLIDLKQTKPNCLSIPTEKVSQSQKVLEKKIISVKFEFKVDSVTKQHKKQNLYRVQYHDGDIRYWTTSQLYKQLNSPIQWIQYLQQNAKWEK